MHEPFDARIDREWIFDGGWRGLARSNRRMWFTTLLAWSL